MVGVASFILPVLNMDVGWSYKKLPQKGDHIRVKRQLYYHHGIYVSDDEVIHFSGRSSDSVLDWSNCEIIVSSLEEFLKGGNLQIRRYLNSEKSKIKDKEYIVKRAKSYIGKKGYNLFTNNCEHFANYCTMDKKISEQVDNLVGLQLPKTLALSFMPKAVLFGGNLGLSLVFALFLSTISKQEYQRSINNKTIKSSNINNKNRCEKSNLDSKSNYPKKEDINLKIRVEKKHSHDSQELYRYTYISDEEFNNKIK